MSRIKDFVAVKLENTGLSADIKVIAFKAVRFRNDEAVDRFLRYVSYEGPLPEETVKRTGITDDLLKENGVSEDTAYKEFFKFIGDDVIVSNNMAFYRAFINSHNTKLLKSKADKKADQEKFFFDDGHRKVSTQWIAQSLYLGVDNYELDTLLDYFDIEYDEADPFGDVTAIGRLLLKLQSVMTEQNKTLDINGYS